MRCSRGRQGARFSSRWGECVGARSQRHVRRPDAPPAACPPKHLQHPVPISPGGSTAARGFARTAPLQERERAPQHVRAWSSSCAVACMRGQPQACSDLTSSGLALTVQARLALPGSGSLLWRQRHLLDLLGLLGILCTHTGTASDDCELTAAFRRPIPAQAHLQAGAHPPACAAPAPAPRPRP